MLTETKQRLIATVRDATSGQTDMQAAAQSLLNAAARATAAEANAALSELAPFIALGDLSRGTFLAVVCGALVENGCDPSALSEPLSRQLQSLLESSAQLAEACNARMPKLKGEKEDNPEVTFEHARQQVARDMPLENAAWEALNTFWRPAIAVFSVSPVARAKARTLRDWATKIAADHEGGHWLRLMLSVLDNEPVLAIEPETRLGMLARMSGVVDNFQLNVLLMDKFPRSGILARRRISKQVADVARGVGPQQTNEIVTGAWNLYNWKAIQPGLCLPDPKGASDCWVWNEGVPEDIPLFEGRRAVLLGPASYSRTWGCQRMFDKLPATLEIERQLTKGEITDWLQKMVAAKAAS
jgi:hypothetical protein